MSRLRVAMVTRRYWPLVGGAATVMAQLAAGLRNEGVESTILTPRWGPSWPAEICHRGTRVVRLPISHFPMLQSVRYAWTLSNWLRRHAEEFDLIYASELKHDGAAAVAVGQRIGVPVVLRAENSGQTGDCLWQLDAHFGRRIKQRCLQAAALLAPSPTIQRELIAAGYPRERIHHSPGGVAESPRRTKDRQLESRAVLAELHPSFGMPAETLLAVFVGRLTEDKELKTLIAAWSALVRQEAARQRPEARLWLVGEGPRHAALADEVHAHGLGDRVTCTGVFDEVDDVLNAADLFVYPVKEAGTAQSLLEAAAAGLPIVASAIPDTQHYLDDGRVGVLRPSHPNALFLAMEELLSSPERAAQLGSQAQDWVRERYSLAATVRRHVELFRELTGDVGTGG